MLKVDSLDELDDVALECRTEGHEWPRGQAVEWIWTKTVRGKVTEVERHFECKSCGTVRRVVYTVHNGVFSRAGNRYTYPTDMPYLVRGGEKGRAAVTRSAVLGVYASRVFSGVRFA